jgi:hypothetical protein
VLVKKKKQSYAGLVEQLQEGHGPFCKPSPRRLMERLLSPGKPGLVASTMNLTRESWLGWASRPPTCVICVCASIFTAFFLLLSCVDPVEEDWCWCSKPALKPHLQHPLLPLFCCRHTEPRAATNKPLNLHPQCCWTRCRLWLPT